eukprot:COSAG01_NODE_13431_length_1586_cov_4.817081_1_plen_239_part_01
MQAHRARMQKHAPPAATQQAWSPPRIPPSLESDQVQVLMAFHESIRMPKSESECQGILEQHKDGAAATLSARRFGKLCHALDREYPVVCSIQTAHKRARMWRCDICSSGWMIASQRHLHVAGQRHQTAAQHITAEPALVGVGSVLEAVSNVTIRAEALVESARVGCLLAGERVSVMEVEPRSGRVRHERGWSSICSKGSGRELLRSVTMMQPPVGGGSGDVQVAASSTGIGGGPAVSSL